MVGEKISSPSLENSGNGSDTFGGDSEYPPFDPEKAKELVAQAYILQSAEEISDKELRQRVLDNEKMLKERQERMKRDEEVARLADEAEMRLGRRLSDSELQDIANRYDARGTNPKKPSGEKLGSSSEYDFKNVDRYQEATFVLAASDSLSDSPDISYIDDIARTVGDKAASNNSSVFETLKQSVQESDTDKEGGYAASDLLNAFIDTTSTYIASKDEKIGRGFAKGLLTGLEMQIDGFTTDKPNPYIDALRVDLSIIRPLADEFIQNYNATYDDPNAFRDYLKTELEMREIDLRSAERRGEQTSSDMEREAQAIKTTMAKLEEMRSHYDKNLKNLHDAAYARHRIIE